MTFRKAALSLMAVLTLQAALKAQTYTESSRVERSFPAHQDTRLDVSNKYGNIRIIPWQKDSVHIEIELNLRSNSLTRLEKIKDAIDFEFSATRYFIMARTNFGNKYEGFFTDLKDLSGTIIPSKNHVEIDYTIRVPSGMALNISNKFGDLYMDDLKGAIDVNLSNGDLKANRLDGRTNINLNFGNGVIDFYQGGRLILSYAGMDIREAGNLDIESKSSELSVDRAGIVDIDSRRDRITATSLKNIFGASYFSDIRITNLLEEANLTARFGDFSVKNVGSRFTYINLNSEYTDIDLAFVDPEGFTMDIIHQRDCILMLPEDNGSFETSNEGDETVRLTGRIGTSDKGRIRITATKKCTISLEVY